MTLEITLFPHVESAPEADAVAAGCYVQLPDGCKGRVVEEIPSFGLLWLVKVAQPVGFRLITVRASTLRVLS